MMDKTTSFKRWHPLLGEWVIFAPVTADRPWKGKIVNGAKQEKPPFDPTCYLCPGVKRANGEINPDYNDVYVFNNDFPTFSLEYSNSGLEHDDVAARGICKVVCFSPRHNVALPQMGLVDMEKVIQALRNEFSALSSVPEIENIMMFENKGEIIGVSNPHPHGQIYATDYMPRVPLTMYNNAKKYRDDQGACLFCAIMDEELRHGAGIVCQNNDFVAFVPNFARFTYEAMIMPRRHVSYITELTGGELRSLAAIYHEMVIRYDNLFQMPFPNITVFHNAPCSRKYDPRPYHFHIEFYPPMRGPDKLKYLAGFESGGGNIINPSLPCQSAEALRSAPRVLYGAPV
jgi:UDPglucose--hexose-1-phosphate uridylyltransferase